MNLSKVQIDALVESAMFYRESVYDPLDPDSLSLCGKIDAFCSQLLAHKLPGMSSGLVQNCCIFLSFFIDNHPHPERLTVHRSLLALYQEILRIHTGE